MNEIEVLLATFNGEEYLAEFLESLMKQEDVEINLVVSDDGSTDDTLEIIETYRNKFKSLRILSGPQKGPSENFFFLLGNSRGKLIALADQDDIWLPNHLSDSSKRIMQLGISPSLSFSSVLEFDSNNSTKNNKWPIRFPTHDIRSVICENLARGCTMVMNKEMLDIINLYNPKNAIMHDWWILLLAFCYGKVIWTENVEIHYRIHNNNFTKRKNRSILNLYKALKFNKWKIILQAKELSELKICFMATSQLSVLKLWIDSLQGHSWSNLSQSSIYIGKYRSKTFQDLVVRGYLFYIASSKHLRSNVHA